MTELKLTGFDFETLCVLAQTDPRSFETLRRQTIDKAIERAPRESRQRLRALQWRIDRMRETSRTPLAACILISNMMWSSFNDLNRVYHQIGEPDEAPGGPGPEPHPARPPAQIVPFRPRGRH